jgi:hypothetical protein
MDEAGQRCAEYAPQRSEHDFNNFSAMAWAPTPLNASSGAGRAMTRLILALAAMALPVSGAIAQQSPPPLKHATSSKARSPAKSKPCPEYGPGFVRVEGSSTCIKVGGYVRIEAGSNVQR